MTTASNPWIMFGVIAALSGLAVEVIWRLIALSMNKTKPWAFLPDEEGGMGLLKRAKMDDGHVIIGKGKDQKRYPINAQARHPTTAGPVYILTRQHGVNLRVPTKKECENAIESQAEHLVFKAVDPGLLARTWTRRVGQETIDNQIEKDDWKKTAILPVAIIAGIAITGMIITVIAFVVKSGS